MRKACRMQRSIKAPALASFKFDLAGKERKERVVFAALDVFARLNFSAALTHQNHAGSYQLAVTDFRAQILWLGVSPEPGRSSRLFMCHKKDWC